MDAAHPRDLRCAAIVGLGLIGGSLARELAARGVRVLGWDLDAHSIERAMAEGAVHQRLADDLCGIGEADAVVVAVPVLAAPGILRGLVPHVDGVRLVTDAGSTKASIVRAAEALGIGDRFVGSHPLAGDHRSGWGASRTGLFGAARVFLTPAAGASAEAIRLAEDLWMMARPGPVALPEVMEAEEHDRRLAWTSHLPQAVSTALALALDANGTPRSELGPGGRDVTRLAGSDPSMWADILADNAGALSPALAMMAGRLESLQRAIAAADHDALRRLFADAREWHQRAP